MLKTIIILAGPPCAGKSTYVEKYKSTFGILPGDRGLGVVSRDQIREDHFPKPYLHRRNTETQVSQIFYDNFKALLIDDSISHILVDNTHCRESYIDIYIDKLIKKKYKDFTVKLYILFLDIPLWKSIFRNFIRFFKTGRWIPIRVIKDMHKSYNKINRKKYEQYIT